MKRNLLLLGASTLLAIALLEAGVALLAQRGWIRITVPTYRYAETRAPFWGDVNRDFGVWHTSREYHQSRPCFEADYRANSYGARDRERTTDSKRPRVIMLGDSFVEGWGVNEKDRLSNLLEARTGYEVMNFGTAGSFGPTQYYLLYKTLAKRFRHDLVVVGINPSNDFADDDPANASDRRYRPYWQGTYPNYRLVYSLDDIRKSTWSPQYRPPRRTPSEEIKHLLRTYSYSYSAYAMLRNREPEREHKSWYFRYNREQFLRLRYSLEQIQKESGGRMLVFTTPTLQDIEEYSRMGRTALGIELADFAQASGTAYTRLLPGFNAYRGNVADLFHPCAGRYHWNAAGNHLAADLLEEPIVRALQAAVAGAATREQRTDGNRP